MVGSPIGCVVFLCEIGKKIKDLARKGLKSKYILKFVCYIHRYFMSLTPISNFELVTVTGNG